MYATVKPFAYHAPTSLQEAVALLAKLGPDAAILAGGCDLLPAMRRRQLTPTAIVSLANVPGLRHVASDRAQLRVGALASLRAVESCTDVEQFYTSLYEGIHGIASVQVRATGTLVGNLCVATPASDIATPLMTMDGKLRVVANIGERIISIADLSVAAKRSSLLPNEVAVEMFVPRPPPTPGPRSASSHGPPPTAPSSMPPSTSRCRTMSVPKLASPSAPSRPPPCAPRKQKRC